MKFLKKYSEAFTMVAVWGLAGVFKWLGLSADDAIALAISLFVASAGVFLIYTIRKEDKYEGFWAMRPWWWHFEFVRTAYGMTWFDKFNAEVFKGKLPRIAIRVEEQRHRVKTENQELLVHKHGEMRYAEIAATPESINLFGWWGANSFKETLLHEMVHAYLLVKDKHAHGHDRKFWDTLHWACEKAGVPYGGGGAVDN